MRLTVPLIAIVALLPAGGALANACGSVRAAFDKLSAVPAMRQTVRIEGKPTVRTVAVGDLLYVDRGTGTWFAVPLPAFNRAQTIRQSMPDAASLSGCREVGSEALDGVATTVIEYVMPPIEGKVHPPHRVWIGDDGLPYRLKAEPDGTSVEVRIDYEDVRAPVP